MKKELVLFALTMLFAIANAQEKIDLNTYWDSGLRFKSVDKNFSFKLGGRIQYDAMFINQDDSLDNHFTAENGSEFRRARLYTSGSIYKRLKYKFQVDFAGNKVVLKDAYIRLTKVPVVGNITVGNFKEPRGFEMITSSNFITMMERSLTNQFDNDRNLGISLYNQYADKRFSVFAGYFFPSGNNAKYSGSEYNLVFRAAGLPIYKVDEKNYKVLHIDAGVTYEDHDNREASYSAKPESHLAPKYLKVTMDVTKSLVEYNIGLVGVYNSLSFEGEYTYSNVNPGAGSVLQNDKYSLSAYYATLSWFITGEHKNYNKSKVAFDRLTPKKNFGKDGGIGAWELAVRYSVLNLNDADLKGGEMDNITVGLNWYLNPVVKVAFNYVRSDIVELGKANIFQTRFQITF